jgi:RimJ/RimL family protein N-acetyltransferase
VRRSIAQVPPSPARPLVPTPLAGRTVRLEPLDPERHAPALFDAAQGDGADPLVWRHLAYGPFPDAAAYAAWARDATASGDPCFFAIVPAGTGPSGVASFLRIEPAHGCIEIGHIWLGGRMQRTTAATEAIFLLLRHAFDDLGHRRVEWKCDAANARSRRAAERFGFTYEGTFRQHMIVKGANRDTAWFALLDGDWPEVRAGFEAWLDPANHDADGRQREPLRAAQRTTRAS